MLLDSNIIIYAAQPEHEILRQFIADNVPFVSIVSYVEVLGYHKLTDDARQILIEFFTAAYILEIDHSVADRAVALRQQRSMSLGDSLIAATALVHGLALVTHNLVDFQWIADLQLIDPVKAN